MKSVAFSFSFFFFLSLGQYFPRFQKSNKQVTSIDSLSVDSITQGSCLFQQIFKRNLNQNVKMFTRSSKKLLRQTVSKIRTQKTEKIQHILILLCLIANYTLLQQLLFTYIEETHLQVCHQPEKVKDQLWCTSSKNMKACQENLWIC